MTQPDGVPTATSQGAVDHQPPHVETTNPTPEPPAPQHVQPVRQPVSYQGPSRADLLAAIESIPERIANTFKELYPSKPLPPAPAADTSDKTDTSAVGAVKSPGRGPRNLYEWYTGNIRD